jgi:hypothetical protein
MARSAGTRGGAAAELAVGLFAAGLLAMLANRFAEAAAWGMLPPILFFMIAIGPGLVALAGLFTGRGMVVAGALLAFLGNVAWWSAQFQAIEDHYAANVKTVDALNVLPVRTPQAKHETIIIMGVKGDWLFGGSGCGEGCMQLLIASPYRIAFEGDSGWLVYRNPATAADCDAAALARSRIAFIMYRYADRCAIPNPEPIGGDGLVIDFNPKVAIPPGANASALELRERVNGKETLLGRLADDVNTPPEKRHALAELLPPSLGFPAEYRVRAGTDTAETLLAALLPLIERADTREQASSTFDYLLFSKDLNRSAFSKATLHLMRSSDPGVRVLGVRALRALEPEDRLAAKPLLMTALDAEDPILVAAALDMLHLYEETDLDAVWDPVIGLATRRPLSAKGGTRDGAIVEPLLRLMRRHRGPFDDSARDAALARLTAATEPKGDELVVAYGLAAHGGAEMEARAKSAVLRLPPLRLSNAVIALSERAEVLNDQKEWDFWNPADLDILAARTVEIPDDQVWRYVQAFCRQRDFPSVRHAIKSILNARIAALQADQVRNSGAIEELDGILSSRCPK